MNLQKTHQIFVSPHGGQWVVKRVGANRATAVLPRKMEAITLARRIAIGIQKGK
jgi:hypothetical protein